MPLTLVAPLTKTFKLEKSDESGETYVTFRQATMREDEKRGGLLADQTYAWNDADVGRIERKTKWSYAELMRLEVFLTMVDCNIMVEGGKDKDGNPKVEPLFQFNKSGLVMTEAQFQEAWGRLPQPVAAEIHKCCLEVNRDWAPNPEQ